ncbi:hypothetical protein C8F01DRAFT_1098482 [Mycena amicta]|nr:hypothetical protein C8F01DRAFT_1098482 [Mycena amicta]
MTARRARAQDRNRLVVVEAEIAMMKPELSRLRTERRCIIRRLTGSAYPVLTLPNEIVVEIFMQCLPVYPSCPPLFGPQSPTHLTHICSLWRTIALGTPMLWRGIKFDGMAYERWRPEGDSDSLAVLPVIRTWLLRSAACRLSLYILARANRDESSMQALIQVLLSAQSRWEYVDLSIFTTALVMQKESIHIAGPLPSLVELNVSGGFQLSVVSDNAPLLHTLHVFALHPSAGGSGNLNQVNWVQLTTLTLSHYWHPLAQCVEILQNTVNLRHCCLHLSGDNTTLPSILRLPSTLQTFIMDFDVSPSSLPFAVGYLQRILGAALRRLRIHSVFLQPNPTEVLTAFLSKSPCPLQHLQFVGRSSPCVIRGEELQRLFPEIGKIAQVPGRYSKPIGQRMEEFFDEAEVFSSHNSGWLKM